jgi:tRNA dimethylallyltransferase
VSAPPRPASPFPTLLAIVGPTASGKTALALEVARLLRCEIVSADSRQVYAGMAIGTAQPSAAEAAAVVHHFVGDRSPGDAFDAGRFGALGRETIDGIFRRGRVPLVVGGSGLYLRSLLAGLFEGPSAERELRDALEERIREAGPAALLEELRAVDPETASRLHPGNTRRIIRALEVHALSGKPISELHRVKPEIPFRAVKAGLHWPRARLYDRINARVIAMVNEGLLDEVRRLLDAGHAPGLRSLQTVGYREAVDHLSGRISREEMIALIQMNTRRFAKRQMTWFRAEPDIRWFDVAGEEEFPRIAREAAALLREASGSPGRAGGPG